MTGHSEAQWTLKGWACCRCDGQWSLPFTSISEIASAISRIFQQIKGERKAPGTVEYMIKSPSSWEMGPWWTNSHCGYMGKIKLNICGINNLMTSQLQLGKGLQPNAEHVSNIFCLCFWGDYLSTLLSTPKLAGLLHLDVEAVPLKFSKPGFSNTWIVNFQTLKLVLEKAEEPEIKLPTSAGSLKKQESSRKTFISALLTMPKPLTVWIT